MVRGRGEIARADRDFITEALEVFDMGGCARAVVCARFAALFEAACVGYVDIDFEAKRCAMVAWPDTVNLSRLITATEQVPEAYPMIVHYAQSGDRTPTTIAAQVGDQRAWRSSDGFAVLQSALGCTEGVAVPLEVGHGQLRMLGLARDVDFSDDEVSILSAAQRSLVALDRHLRYVESYLWDVRAGLPDAGIRSVDAAQALGVTPREHAVLSLLAEGLTATTVGRRLGISPRTVHKHLEHLYQKLGTSDRLIAVTQARKWGLLPPTEGPIQRDASTIARSLTSLSSREDDRDCSPS